MTIPARRSRCTIKVIHIRFSSHAFSPPLIVIYPFLLTDQLDHRHDHDDNEDEQRNRCRVSLISIVERLTVEQHNYGLGIVVCRICLTDHHVNGIKYLESADDRCDQHEEDRRRQHRDRNLEELLDRACAVQCSRFIIKLLKFPAYRPRRMIML